MYKFAALLVVLSSVSLTLASPYGSRLMSHSSSYAAAPAPVAPVPGIFEVPAATPFVEVTTAGYGERAISKEVVITEVVTEAPTTQGYGSAPVLDVVTPAPELPILETTQAYGSVPTTTQGYAEVPATPEIALEETTTPFVEITTAGYGQRAISKEVVITEVVTEAPTTQGYGSAPVFDIVTPAPELPVAPVAPVTEAYGSAPTTQIALEETTTPFVEVTTAGYGQRAISKEVVITEVVTEAPTTQGYGSAPVLDVVTPALELPVAPVTQGYGSAPALKSSSY